MAKESITLPDILRVLGDRPYPLKENVREYLEELKERTNKEEEAAANTPAEDANKSETDDQQPPSAPLDTDDKEPKTEQ